VRYWHRHAQALPRSHLEALHHLIDVSQMTGLNKIRLSLVIGFSRAAVVMRYDVIIVRDVTLPGFHVDYITLSDFDK
jgi:hypothetical protein